MPTTIVDFNRSRTPQRPCAIRDTSLRPKSDDRRMSCLRCSPLRGARAAMLRLCASSRAILLSNHTRLPTTTPTSRFNQRCLLCRDHYHDALVRISVASGHNATLLSCRFGTKPLALSARGLMRKVHCAKTWAGLGILLLLGGSFHHRSPAYLFDLSTGLETLFRTF